MLIRTFATILAFALLGSGIASAQMFTDFKPGGATPKSGYTPDPKKVMYVIFWHHKKLTTQFDHVAFYMDADGVNDTTADKIVKLMQERYPNLIVYKKETNERDIKDTIKTQKERIKNIEKDWVDLKQPKEIAGPKLYGRAKFGYDEDGEKEKPSVALEGTSWGGTTTVPWFNDDSYRAMLEFGKENKVTYSSGYSIRFKQEGELSTTTGKWTITGKKVEVTWDSPTKRPLLHLTIDGTEMKGTEEFKDVEPGNGKKVDGTVTWKLQKGVNPK